eukprot:scaffold70718_cov20-Prasinocladus_malaysianus.AAC.1
MATLASLPRGWSIVNTAPRVRYAETDKRFQEENQKLTDEYKRITEQFKFLQGKFRHFELSDIKKYHDIWNMKERTVADLVHEVLQVKTVEYRLQFSRLPRPTAWAIDIAVRILALSGLRAIKVFSQCVQA